MEKADFAMEKVNVATGKAEFAMERIYVAPRTPPLRAEDCNAVAVKGSPSLTPPEQEGRDKVFNKLHETTIHTPLGKITQTA